MNCTRCGAENPGDARFCSLCFEELERCSETKDANTSKECQENNKQTATKGDEVQTSKPRDDKGHWHEKSCQVLLAVLLGIIFFPITVVVILIWLTRRVSERYGNVAAFWFAIILLSIIVSSLTEMGNAEKQISSTEEKISTAASLPESDSDFGKEPIERYPGAVMLDHDEASGSEPVILITYGTKDDFQEVAEWYKIELETAGWVKICDRTPPNGGKALAFENYSKSGKYAMGILLYGEEYTSIDVTWEYIIKE